jgi:two-component system chemotaxis response regulator CheY
MISTEAQAQDKRRAWEAGANFYLTKPIKPDALLAYVRLLLGQGGTA